MRARCSRPSWSSRTCSPACSIRFSLDATDKGPRMIIFSGTQNQPQYNRPLYGTHGKYTLSAGVAVPYFLTAMPIERAIEELKIHEQIPPNLDNRWSLSELFQREIDQDRVIKQLVNGYL